MAKIGFDKATDRIGRAMDRVGVRVDRIVGTKVDEDLVFYENLKPEDFQSLSDMYGPDSVAGYVKEMEIRRLKANG